MGALERDPIETAAQLACWLTEVGGLDEVTVDDVSIPGATGWSNETIMFTATWRGTGGAERHPLVARIAPTEYTVFPDPTFTAQYDLMKTLAEHTDVPMAAIHWFEPSVDWFDSPFWIMDHVAGTVPTDSPPYAQSGWLHDASPADQQRAWSSGVDAMARIHRLDPEALGIRRLAVPSGDDPLTAQLDHYERFLHWAEGDRPHDDARAALALLRRVAPPPPAQGPALSWGDSRLSNLIFRDFTVAAVLDWEMAGIADPLLDLGWWLFADETLTRGAGCDRLPGFASREDTAQQWSDLTGRSHAALDYYELLAGLRFTVIMLRMGKLLHDMGLVPPEFAYENFISQAMSDRL